MTDVYEAPPPGNTTHQYTPGTPCYQVPSGMDWDMWRGKMNTVVTLLFETCRQQEERVRRRSSTARI